MGVSHVRSLHAMSLWIELSLRDQTPCLHSSMNSFFWHWHWCLLTLSWHCSNNISSNGERFLSIQENYKPWLNYNRGKELFQDDLLPMNKSHMATWIVSNCVTNSRREDFVKQMSKLVKIKIYGGCVQKPIPKGYGKSEFAFFKCKKFRCFSYPRHPKFDRENMSILYYKSYVFNGCLWFKSMIHCVYAELCKNQKRIQRFKVASKSIFRFIFLLKIKVSTESWTDFKSKTFYLSLT